MDMPNEYIVNAILQENVGNNDPPLDVEFPEMEVLMTVTREFRSNDSQIGAGDGLHNNTPFDMDEDIQQFIIFRGRPYSKLWEYLPMLILMSSLVFRCVVGLFGIDTQCSTLWGISYSTHFNILQWIILFATYYFKRFSN